MPIGRTRLDRLVLIGRSSVVLCVDALKAAVHEARKGRDTEAYQEVVELLHHVAPNEPEAAMDTMWIANTNRSNEAEKRRLEAELKGYKNNLIKESIRVRRRRALRSPVLNRRTEPEPRC